MSLTLSPKNVGRQVPLMALPALLATAMVPAQATVATIEPNEVIEIVELDPREAMGLALAYGIILIERLHRNELDQEEFQRAVSSIRNITRLIGERELEAACMLLRTMEDRYDFERPELDAHPHTALYRERGGEKQ